MWRWLNWAARIVATALLLSFLSIWTTGYIVNSYMETVLKQLNLPLETQPFALSGIWGALWGADPVPQAQELEGGTDSPESGVNGTNQDSFESSLGGLDDRSGSGSSLGGKGYNGDFGSATGADGENGSFGSQSGADDDDGGTGSSRDEENPMNSGDGSASGSGIGQGGTDRSSGENGTIDDSSAGDSTTPYADSGGSATSTADPDASDATQEDAVPVFGGQAGSAVLSDEQRKMLNTVMSKLNADQLSALSGYLQGGLTLDELTAVQELVKPSLSDAEYDQLMEVFNLDSAGAKSGESASSASE